MWGSNSRPGGLESQSPSTEPARWWESNSFLPRKKKHHTAFPYPPQHPVTPSLSPPRFWDQQQKLESRSNNFLRKARAGWGWVGEGCVCFESLGLLRSGRRRRKRRRRRGRREKRRRRRE